MTRIYILRSSSSTNKRCSRFINLDNLSPLMINADSSFLCPGCGTQLCSSCRTSHRNLTCAQYLALPETERSPDDLAFFALATDHSYSRCMQCLSFVELTQGCNHIQCVCRYNFCYMCRKPWKTCSCPLWQERYVITEARIRAGENAREDRIFRIAENIRNERHCVGQHLWQKRNRHLGPCRNCGFYCYIYHFECSSCRFAVCNTCRFYRIG